MDYVGAIKIKDGLFLGDQYAAHDLEFIISNKVTHVINTASHEVANHWEPIGVKYLNFYWNETEQFLDTNALDQSCAWLVEASTAGGGVLVHSVRGQIRAVALLLGLMMKGYSWGLSKAIDFLLYRKPDLNVLDCHLHQLSDLEISLQDITSTWTQLSQAEDSEELVLRNTFVNAQNAPFADYSHIDDDYKQPSIRWGEAAQCRNPVEHGFVLLKSCLKQANKARLKVPLSPFKRPLAFSNASPNAMPRAACAGVENRSVAAHSSQSRNRPLTSGLRPPSPLIKSNRIVHGLKKPSWR